MLTPAPAATLRPGSRFTPYPSRPEFVIRAAFVLTDGEVVHVGTREGITYEMPASRVVFVLVPVTA